MNISVAIVPIGDLNSEDLEYLEEELKAKFGNCTVENKVQTPVGAYNPQRGQYMSGILLQRLPIGTRMSRLSVRVERGLPERIDGS